jgi:hypothetical protein
VTTILDGIAGNVVSFLTFAIIGLGLCSCTSDSGSEKLNASAQSATVGDQLDYTIDPDMSFIFAMDQKPYPMPKFFADAIRKQLSQPGDSKTDYARPASSATIRYDGKNYLYCAGNLWIEGGDFWPASRNPILASAASLPRDFFTKQEVWKTHDWNAKK